MSGGTLTVNGTLLNQGTIDGGGGAATLVDNGLVDFTAGTWKNYSAWSVNVGANSLLVVPAGFNPSTAFGSYSSQGLLYSPGSTLDVPAGKGFSGTYSFNDPVICQGTITASGGTINLAGGLTVSGNGSVSTGGGNLTNGLKIYGNGSVKLGNGNLTVNDVASGMSGGTLSAYNEYIGYSGTGTFTQSGGSNAATYNFYLGYNATDSGTYNLSGGTLSSPSGYSTNAVGNEFIGYSGTGSFTQSGGSNAITSYLGLGYNTGGKGTYNLRRRHVERLSLRRGRLGHGHFHPGRRHKRSRLYRAGLQCGIRGPTSSRRQHLRRGRGRRLFRRRNLHPGRRHQCLRPERRLLFLFALRRPQLRRHRHVQPDRRCTVHQQGRVRGLLRRGHAHAVGRNEHRRHGPLSWLQHGQQRNL